MPNRYLVAALLIFAGATVWTFWPRPVPEVGKSTPLPPAREVRTVEKIVERVKYVKVYPSETKAKLNLPDAVIKNQAQKVIATGKLNADEREYSLSAVLDTETGDSQVYAKPLPLPWVGPGRRGAVGIAYGLTNDGPAVKMYSYQELLRIKKLNAGVRAEADQHGEYWAGFYVEAGF